jgi:hypothetical protein
MWSTIEARVVDFPLPVVPVHRMSPLVSRASFSITFGRCNASKERAPIWMTRTAIPIVLRCRKRFTRNRPSPGTL